MVECDCNGRKTLVWSVGFCEVKRRRREWTRVSGFGGVDARAGEVLMLAHHDAGFTMQARKSAQTCRTKSRNGANKRIGRGRRVANVAKSAVQADWE